MEGPAFKSQPQWAGCYCQFYLNTEQQNEPVEGRAVQNRGLACDRINAGTMQGYLAFEGSRVIGWMAANRANNFVALPKTGDDVARIICFNIEHEHQNQGVATRLLEFALRDLANLGFTSVEAAPLAAADFVAHGYRGPLSMFLKAGFVQAGMLDQKHVLVQRKLTA
ncbi:MAG: GNAT family N-acetyltransferase [Micrococcales bacterium]